MSNRNSGVIFQTTVNLKCDLGCNNLIFVQKKFRYQFISHHFEICCSLLKDNTCTINSLCCGFTVSDT